METIKLLFQFKVWEPTRDFFIRIWFCQHNARVIADFEDRMSIVIYTATNGKMSKPYYDKAAMVTEIEDAFSEQYNQGYEDAKLDFDIKELHDER